MVEGDVTASLEGTIVPEPTPEFVEQQVQAGLRAFIDQGLVGPDGMDDTHDAQVTPLDLLTGDYVDPGTRQDRLEACKQCPRLFQPTRTCRECLCFMSLKTWLKDATCPLSRWDRGADVTTQPAVQP